MRSETTYYAFDDTEFDSAAECLEYEEKLTQSMGSVAIFDADMCRLEEPSLMDIESDASFFVVLNAERAETLFDWLYEQISFGEVDDFSDGSVLRYSSETGRWADLRDEVDSLNELIARLSKDAGLTS